MQWNRKISSSRRNTLMGKELTEKYLYVIGLLSVCRQARDLFDCFIVRGSKILQMLSSTVNSLSTCQGYDAVVSSSPTRHLSGVIHHTLVIQYYILNTWTLVHTEVYAIQGRSLFLFSTGTLPAGKLALGVTFLTIFGDTPCSNLGRDTNIHDWGFRVFT
jgi:hypothetical protein